MRMRLLYLSLFLINFPSTTTAQDSNWDLLWQDQTLSNDNICVISVIIGPKFQKYKEKIIKNKRSYCQHMNYTCYLATDVVKQEQRPLAWQKVHTIDIALHTQECNILLWIDGDAIFMNYQPVPTTSKDITVSKDHNGINTGVMIIKTTSWTDTFFHRVASTSTFDYHNWWEQAAIIHFVNKEPETRKHIEYLPQASINSYDVYNAPFIYHPAGCGKNCMQQWDVAFKQSKV
jgi:hypothetical protein